jgi:ammonia channel protein AmtB
LRLTEPYPHGQYEDNEYEKDDLRAAHGSGLLGLIAEGGLWFEQLKAILITLLLSGVVSAMLAFFQKAVIRVHERHATDLGALDISKDAERT